MVGFVGRIVAVATFAAVGMMAAGGSHADMQPDTQPTATPAAPAIGGLSLVPDRWRYHPNRPVATAATEHVMPPQPGQPRHAALGLGTLDAGYVPDRLSFVNTLRARRGLSLLTLWEGAGRCLFFGINERGRAGINFVRMRTLRNTATVENPLHEMYAELTGQARPTFPEPPRLFPH